ncbi:MAG: thiopurine S-methyltransferase [Pseudomonadota bacterium]
MEAQFWHKRWEKDELGFDQPQPNALMVSHFQALGLAKGARVFVPLCGKTIDIKWLLDQGMHVAGAELSEIAVSDLFKLLGIEPTITDAGSLKHYHADGIDIWAGDIFDLDAETLGPVDATYDRAAVVALPEGMRDRYVAHVAAITGQTQQLTITFDYDQSVMDGPPFSVPSASVHGLYDDLYTVTELTRANVEGKLKGQAVADEIIWLMR